MRYQLNIGFNIGLDSQSFPTNGKPVKGRDLIKKKEKRWKKRN